MYRIHRIKSVDCSIAVFNPIIRSFYLLFLFPFFFFSGGEFAKENFFRQNENPIYFYEHILNPFSVCNHCFYVFSLICSCFVCRCACVCVRVLLCCAHSIPFNWRRESFYSHPIFVWPMCISYSHFQYTYKCLHCSNRRTFIPLYMWNTTDTHTHTAHFDFLLFFFLSSRARESICLIWTSCSEQQQKQQ